MRRPTCSLVSGLGYQQTAEASCDCGLLCARKSHSHSVHLGLHCRHCTFVSCELKKGIRHVAQLNQRFACAMPIYQLHTIIRLSPGLYCAEMKTRLGPKKLSEVKVNPAIAAAFGAVTPASSSGSLREWHNLIRCLRMLRLHVRPLTDNCIVLLKSIARYPHTIQLH